METNVNDRLDPHGHNPKRDINNRSSSSLEEAKHVHDVGPEAESVSVQSRDDKVHHNADLKEDTKMSCEDIPGQGPYSSRANYDYGTFGAKNEDNMQNDAVSNYADGSKNIEESANIVAKSQHYGVINTKLATSSVGSENVEKQACVSKNTDKCLNLTNKAAGNKTSPENVKNNSCSLDDANNSCSGYSVGQKAKHGLSLQRGPGRDSVPFTACSDHTELNDKGDVCSSDRFASSASSENLAPRVSFQADGDFQSSKMNNSPTLKGEVTPSLDCRDRDYASSQCRSFSKGEDIKLPVGFSGESENDNTARRKLNKKRTSRHIEESNINYNSDSSGSTNSYNYNDKEDSDMEEEEGEAVTDNAANKTFPDDNAKAHYSDSKSLKGSAVLDHDEMLDDKHTDIDLKNPVHGDDGGLNFTKGDNKSKVTSAKRKCKTQQGNKAGSKKKTKDKVAPLKVKLSDGKKGKVGKVVKSREEPLNLSVVKESSSADIERCSASSSDATATRLGNDQDKTSADLDQESPDTQPTAMSDFSVVSFLNNIKAGQSKPKKPRRRNPNLKHICEICNFITNRRSHLVRHMRIHTGEKPYKCKFCDYVGKQPIDLTRHVMRHTGEKPFKCSMCDYECSQKSNLNRHIRIHTGEKPYKCDVCQFFTSQKGSLMRHMRSHQGDKVYKLKCGYCEYVTNSDSHLSKHVKSHTEDLMMVDMSQVLVGDPGMVDGEQDEQDSNSQG